MPDGYRPRNYSRPSDSSIDKQQKLETEISLDFNNFPLDNIGSKEDFFRNLFALGRKELSQEDKHYFLAFGISENILNENEDVWYDNYSTPANTMPYEIRDDVEGFGANYVSSDKAHAKNVANLIIDHYMYEADLTIPETFDTLRYIQKYFPDTYKRKIEQVYINAEKQNILQLPRERIKLLNSLLSDDDIPYKRISDGYKAHCDLHRKYLDTLPDKMVLKDADELLRSNPSLSADDVQDLRRECENITGSSLNLLSNGMTRADSMLEFILRSTRDMRDSPGTACSEDCIQTVILSSQFKGRLNTFSKRDLEKLYWYFMHYPENTKEACEHILDIAGPDIGKGGRTYRTEALLYFYQKDELNDEQIRELKSDKDLMKNQAIKDIFYSKGDVPFLNESLGWLIRDGLFNESDAQKVSTLTFNSNKEKAETISGLLYADKSQAQINLAMKYLTPLFPLDPKELIGNFECTQTYANLIDRFPDKIKFDEETINMSIAYLMKARSDYGVPEVIIKLLDNVKVSKFIENGGNIETLGAFVIENKDKIRNFNDIFNDIAKVDFSKIKIQSDELLSELAKRGATLPLKSSQDLISYRKRGIEVDIPENPKVYDFNEKFLCEASYHHSDGSHTTFLNEMLWYKDKEGSVMALNNGASPFTKAGFFRDKFEAMPFNMFFNRELKNNNDTGLKDFMEFIASNINEDKKDVIKDIWTSLGGKLRSDPHVQKIMYYTDQIIKTRFPSISAQRIQNAKDRIASHQEKTQTNPSQQGSNSPKFSGGTGPKSNGGR